MSVQAKFFVAEVTITSAGQDQGTVVLRAVSRGAVNARWARATPSGEFRMHVSNPDAFLWFKDRIGQECRINVDAFTPDPSDHAFIEHPDAKGAKERHEWGADLCAECGYGKDEHR